LALFAFGEEGLLMGVAFFVVIALSQFTVTPVVASGRFSVRQLASTPIIYAVAASLVFMFTGLSVPKWLANTTQLLGNLTIPLLLITLGISLAQLRVGDLKNSLWVSIVRLSLGFGIGVLLAEALGLEGAAKGIVILQSSMPVAVFNYLFAQQFKTEAEGVAGTVVTSTLLTFLSLPFLMWYVLDFAA
ncbi:MAG: AEC family transporter, partial [Rhodospirillales bacterium]|nr:AEC family transporter [Rhodospirillales bacterium]